jgi:hypothetical protein
MQTAARLAGRIVIYVAGAVAVVLALVWPWPAPAVDWQTPLQAALAKSDCVRAKALISAAASAGEIDAYEFLANPSNRTGCLADPSSLPELPDQGAASLRFQRDTAATWGPDASFDAQTDLLDFGQRHYTRLADVLCRQPYDTLLQTDQVALSAAVPEDGSWSLALHRWRREVCIDVLENLANSLANQPGPHAKNVAYRIVTSDPLSDSTTAGFVRATLLLEQQFLPASPMSKDSRSLEIMRTLAWSGLQRAARAHDPAAIVKMIDLLHARRFIREGLFTRGPQQEAYFWVLRSRRLKLTPSPLHDEIEGALANSERTDVMAREKLDWDTFASQPEPTAQ